MTQSVIHSTENHMKSLVKDAQELFREAASVTGEKADDLRRKGLSLLDTALTKAQDVQASAIQKGKNAVKQTDEYVQESPWKAVAISASLSLLVGYLIARK